MNFICRLFRQDPESRDGLISAASALNIVVNILLAAVKIIIGLLASSIAIVSEGANGAADALSSALTLIGAKLARKHPDAKHPFGYGRIEYLVSLAISALILVTGMEMLSSSIRLILHPEEVNVSYIAVIIIAVSAAVKYFLGVFTVRMGKKADSGSLIGVGTECRNDAFASVITIAASLIFILTGTSVDAYAGIITSVLIIKAGAELFFATIGDLLGRPGKQELALSLYREIRRTDGIVYAADMMLHNYGPDAWSGSVNVEIDRKKTVGEIYQILHALQLRIMHEYRVTMVFGVYAIDNDNPESVKLRKALSSYIRQHEHLKSYHAVYIDEKDRTVYFDIIVDYDLKDWDALEADLKEYVKSLYPGYDAEITIETEFV